MSNDTQTKEDNIPGISGAVSVMDINEMAQKGVYIGKVKSKSHPKMKNFIFGTRHNIQIIDLEKTAQRLLVALEFLKKTVDKKGVILFVGTKMPGKMLTKEAAMKCGMPYVDERWLGGILTNSNTLLKRIEYFISLEKQKATGELAKYTKREQLHFEKEIADLAGNFDGLRSLKRLPEAIFVIDASAHNWAVREGNKMKIPVVAIANTDTDPSQIQYIIPANSESLDSIKFILDKVVETIGAKPEAPATL